MLTWGLCQRTMTSQWGFQFIQKNSLWKYIHKMDWPKTISTNCVTQMKQTEKTLTRCCKWKSWVLLKSMVFFFCFLFYFHDNPLFYFIFWMVETFQPEPKLCTSWHCLPLKALCDHLASHKKLLVSDSSVKTYLFSYKILLQYVSTPND